MRPGILALIAGACLLVPGPAAQATEIGDPDNGEEVFKQCAGCHQMGPGARNRIGPTLNEVFGRPAAGVEGFRYSKALRQASEEGLIWTLDNLDAYLEAPRDFVPGTRMSFRGLPNKKDRDDVLAYMRAFTASPMDIPGAEPTARPTEITLTPEILAIRGDPAYGEYLSSECKTCHQADGSDEGIPSITLWPEEDFVLAMHAYKQKVRDHPVMQMMAGRLSDEEIAALAAYFGSLEED